MAAPSLNRQLLPRAMSESNEYGACKRTTLSKARGGTYTARERSVDTGLFRNHPLRTFGSRAHKHVCVVVSMARAALCVLSGGRPSTNCCFAFSRCAAANLTGELSADFPGAGGINLPRPAGSLRSCVLPAASNCEPFAHFQEVNSKNSVFLGFSLRSRSRF